MLQQKIKKNLPAKKKKIKKKTPLNLQETIDLIKKSLEDGKAQDIVIIDLEGKSSIADCMIVASGTSQRQVVSLAERVATDLKKAGVKSALEGKNSGEWVIVDALDVIVHIFYPETRAFYSLEDMWKNIPVQNNESQK